MKYRINDRDTFQVVGINREIPYDAEDKGKSVVQGFWGEVHGNGIVSELIQIRFV